MVETEERVLDRTLTLARRTDAAGVKGPFVLIIGVLPKRLSSRGRSEVRSCRVVDRRGRGGGNGGGLNEETAGKRGAAGALGQEHKHRAVQVAQRRENRYSC